MGESKETGPSKKIDKSAEYSFISGFYNEVQILLENYTLYKNIVKELEVNTEGKDEALREVDPKIRNSILQYSGACSSGVESTYIKYRTIIEVSKEENTKDEDKTIKQNENIEEIYKDLSKQLILGCDDLRNYVMEMNKFIAINLMKNMFKGEIDKTKELFGY